MQNPDTAWKNLDVEKAVSRLLNTNEHDLCIPPGELIIYIDQQYQQ